MSKQNKFKSVEKMPLLGGYDTKGKKILPVYKNDDFHKMIYAIYKKQESFPWTVEEIKLGGDKLDWHSNLNPAEKHVIEFCLSLFTGSDASAVIGYGYLMRVFKPVCFSMLYAKIASVEALHVDAYSYISDELGFDADYYKQLNEVEETKEFVPMFLNSRVKGFEHYISLAENKFRRENAEDAAIPEELIRVEADRLFKIALAKFILTYGILLESCHLFSLFAILFSFRRVGKMKGMGTVVEWSIRDEYIHYNANILAYNILLETYPEVFTPQVKSGLKRWTKNNMDTLKQMEYNFIDKAFEKGDIPSMKKSDLISYIDYIFCDRQKLLEIPVAPEDDIKDNPLEWMDSVLSNNNLTNFFSDTVTDYQKNSTRGSWDDVKNSLPELAAILLNEDGKRFLPTTH